MCPCVPHLQRRGSPSAGSGGAVAFLFLYSFFMGLLNFIQAA